MTEATLEKPDTEVPETPEELREAIIDLANQTFDRITPRLQPFIADQRRDRGRDATGTTLTSDNENVLWNDGRYGDFCMFTGRKAAQQEVFNAFAGSRVVREFAGPFGPAGAHEKLVRESKLYPDYDETRFRPVGAVLLLRLVRDRFPRDDTDYRESLMGPRRSLDEVPPGDWGERHGIGVRLITRYEDGLVPDRGATWRLDIDAQTRFDRYFPQIVLTSRFDGLIDTRDLGHRGDFDSFIRETRNSGEYDFDRMKSGYMTLQRCFALARDLRPWVTPIDQQLRSQAAFEALVAESGFFSADTVNDS